MSTQKQKFQLFSQLRDLGFTYEEAAALRRISMTLSRWSVAECNGEIERNEATGKYERVSQAWINGSTGKRTAWPIADREAGALRRMRAIVAARNVRETEGGPVLAYHQADPRGCALYLVRLSELPAMSIEEIKRHSGPQAGETEESRIRVRLSSNYSRGVAVCA